MLKTNKKKYLKNKRRKAYNFLIGVVIALVTCVGAVSSAEAFSFKIGKFNFNIGENDNKEIDTARERQQERINNESVKNEEFVQADIYSLINRANNDPYAVTALKSFEGDNFCVKTDKRVAYAFIDVDGSINLLNNKPKRCYQIKTSETYLSRVSEKIQNNELISEKEISRNVKFPWRLKAKLMFEGLLS